MKHIPFLSRAEQQSIIVDIGSPYRDYPLQHITEEAVALFRSAASMLNNDYREKRYPQLITALECYLQLTEKTLTLSSLTSGSFISIYLEMLGALNSPRFIDVTLPTRYKYSRTWTLLMKTINPGMLNGREIPLSATSVPSEIAVLVRKFNSMELSPHAESIWRAWPTFNQHGKLYWIPLRKIYEKLGIETTDAFYTVLSSWYEARRSDKIPVIKELADYIETYPGITPASLKNRVFVTNFWNDFWLHHSEERKSTCLETTIISNWANQWVSIATEFLTPSIFAPQYGAFPGPDKKNVTASEDGTSTLSSGALEELLVIVPLGCSDNEALQFLCKAIPESVQTAVTWANTEVALLMQRHRRRKALALAGSVKAKSAEYAYTVGSLVDADVAGYLEIASASYEHFGHQTTYEVPNLQLRYPYGLRETAYELGLPTSLELLSFATLLIAEHPQITPSFLEHLTLFDKYKRLSGLRRTNDGWYLIGVKYRKGKKHGQQRIKLTRKSLRVVLKLLAVTRSYREYMIKHGDTGWKMLFISGSGFRKPMPIRDFAPIHHKEKNINALVAQFSENCGMPHEHAVKYVNRFSLRAVRSTKALTVFIEKRSEAAMAKALGHEEHLPGLLSRYLPNEFVAFFRNRWIRAFQLRLVIEAVKDTPFLMKATGFETVEELDTFLVNNAFPNITKLSTAVKVNSEQSTERSDGNFVFNANKENLTALINISNAVKNAKYTVNATAMFWSELGDHVVAYIEKQNGMNPTISQALRAAKEDANSTVMEPILYD
ncbi:hypothetical protein [Noviherbaspirillum aerium]|uniref:hypothetical protein n=1 Tax=Noviherbaspirillum aerium TaxID=2588497 RepID=UPI00124F6407|nr:hypothetical protein [Noviherbaspirillum aerium]